MTLADIDRDAVLKAIEEFKRLKRKRFLDKYGFRISRNYLLRYEGELYDSKAILGAAHGFAKPAEGPLTWNKFRGGTDNVVKRLKELGFEVHEKKTTDGAARAFLLTWTAKGWPHENLVRIQKKVLSKGSAKEKWRVRSYREVEIGDKVWLC